MFKMLSNMKSEEIEELLGGKIVRRIFSWFFVVFIIVSFGSHLIPNELVRGIIVVGTFSLLLIFGTYAIIRINLYYFKTKAKRQKNE